MLKNSTWKLEDTNLAEFGSALEKERRKEEGALETAWGEGTGVGSEVGRWIWRIESFEVVPVPKKDYGVFYNGDSYIILNSYTKENSDVLLHDIHFWLGEETSQDEAGTAAYKTVELDDYLDGKPIQHREVQGYESKQFLSYFRMLSIQKGGVNSGFRHWTEPEYPSRLLMVKSAPHNGGHKSSVVVREVNKDDINSGDVFILDTGKVLYQWNGKDSSGVERVKAAEYIRGLEADRASNINVEVFDEGDRDQRIFWAALGGEVKVKPAEEMASEPEYIKKLFRELRAGGDGGGGGGAEWMVVDEAAAFVVLAMDTNNTFATIPYSFLNTWTTLYSLSNASGKLEFTLEGSGPEVTAELLDSNDVFILDVQHEVFVWVGANASAIEHRNGLHYAQEYINRQGLARHTPIAKVMEEGDHVMFDNAIGRF
ncbi:hypothetical protein BGZ94_004916 [Podila epigama]|nr:hypothetical protein BGZ94_004916 [Podila epigama]